MGHRRRRASLIALLAMLLATFLLVREWMQRRAELPNTRLLRDHAPAPEPSDPPAIQPSPEEHVSAGEEELETIDLPEGAERRDGRVYLNPGPAPIMDPAQLEAEKREMQEMAERQRIERDAAPHSTDLPRGAIPEPKGPRAGESLPDYVGRVIRAICELDGATEKADERAGWELELEAYARKHPETVQDIVHAARSSEDYGFARVGLLVLGRLDSPHGMDFLFAVARGEEQLQPTNPAPKAVQVSPTQANPNGYTGFLSAPPPLRESAIEALFQCAGKTGPRAPPYRNSPEVGGFWTTLDKPALFQRILDTLADPAVPATTRAAILSRIGLSLPDPAAGGSGDVPRPRESAALAERALGLVLEQVSHPATPEIQMAALVSLYQTQRPEAGRRLLEILTTNGPTMAAESIATAAGRFAHDPTVRDGILDVLVNHPQYGVRAAAAAGLDWRTVQKDSFVQRALLDTIRGDPHVQVRLAAVATLMQRGNTRLRDAAIRDLESGGLDGLSPESRRSMASGLKIRIREWRLPVEQRRRLEDISARLMR